ncbi:MAG TPA: CHAT domain-containing tetratricopeptide repeat protein [Ktedonobacteraceae bacterium]|nr:CHAT domain-containing tetratricopeptide repeat protein [Ktedonobacteraceae bacterium]
MQDTIETDQLLEQLKELSLEEGRRLIVEHASALDDPVAFGVRLADEALELSYANAATSLKLAELLIFFGEHIQHRSSYALGLKAKGDMLKVIGLHQGALECLDAAGEEFLIQGDEGNWARSRISWIISCAWLGETEKALQEAERARETFIRLGEPYWACLIIHNTAMIYESMGRYQEALELYQYNIVTYPTLTDQSDHVIKRTIALTQLNQAYDLALLGHFEEAYHLQKLAQSSFRTLHDTSCVITTEMNLAELDYTQGYYGSALRRYYESLELITREAIDEPSQLASLKLWMANCYMKLNRVQEACQLAEEAVAIQRRLGISLETSDALREYAATLIAVGRLPEALATLDEAILLFERGKLDYYSAITKLQQVELLLEMGRAAEAYQQAELLKSYFDRKKLVSRSVRAALVMVGALKVMAQSENVRQAIALGKKVAAQARQHNLQEEAYKSNHLLGQLFSSQGDIKRATNHYRVAIAQIERMLDHLVPDLSPAFLHTTWKIYEEMIAHCLGQSQFAQAFGYLERARSIALRQHLSRIRAPRGQSSDDALSVAQTSSATILRLQKELNEWQEQYRQYSALLADTATLTTFSLDRSAVEQELKRCEAKLSELFERLHIYQSTVEVPAQKKHKKTAIPYRLDLSQLRRQLEPGQCLLAYFAYQGKLVIFLLTKEALVTREVPGGAARLESLLLLLYAHLQPMGWSDIQHPPQEAVRRLLQRLYTILLAPLDGKMPFDTKSLLVIPFGSLHDLPFHALHDGTQFLIERFQISYLPASSLLVHLNNSSREVAPGSAKTPPVEHRSPLILGYAGTGHARRTLDEANMLAELLKGRCYLEQEATIARLVEEAPGRSLIHIATHGHARLDAPHFSSVLLADGEFNAIDAFQLDIKGCQLITLSCCETGKALISGGDEQLGLGQAFLAAGAKSLLMSLWPVEDHATDVLMQHFYQRLLDGETKAEALRAAQCHLLHHSTSMHAHPYFWAAFRLVGDTGVFTTGMSATF